LDSIQDKRKNLWKVYYKLLKPLEEKNKIRLPAIPDYATNNAHMFYVLCRNAEEKNKLMKYLQANGIYAVFHYSPLHKSPYYKDKNVNDNLHYCDYYSGCLLRLPLYYSLTEKEAEFISEKITYFFNAG